MPWLKDCPQNFLDNFSAPTLSFDIPTAGRSLFTKYWQEDELFATLFVFLF